MFKHSSLFTLSISPFPSLFQSFSLFRAFKFMPQLNLARPVSSSSSLFELCKFSRGCAATLDSFFSIPNPYLSLFRLFSLTSPHTPPPPLFLSAHLSPGPQRRRRHRRERRRRTTVQHGRLRPRVRRRRRGRIRIVSAFTSATLTIHKYKLRLLNKVSMGC
jgi:hypothetical protein